MFKILVILRPIDNPV